MSTPGGLNNAALLARENGVQVVTSDFEELCRTGIDTVYVAVPNFLHFDYCVKALEKKRNVIVEKPMTSNVREAKELKTLAVKNQCFLFEAVTTVYLGNYQKIREWLPRIGSIKMAKSEFSQYSGRYDAFLAGEVLPVFDPQKSGGALMDLNLYNLHYIMGLFGEPVGYQYYANVERGIDTSGVLVMQYPDFVALCIAAKDSKGSVGGIIQGTKGVICSQMAANSVGGVMLKLNDGTVEKYDDGMAEKRMIPEFETFYGQSGRMIWTIVTKCWMRALQSAGYRRRRGWMRELYLRQIRRNDTEWL
jgi:predicted dehydrogenase